MSSQNCDSSTAAPFLMFLLGPATAQHPDNKEFVKSKLASEKKHLVNAGNKPYRLKA